MEAINDIILSGSNIGQSLNERLESIDNNFTEIGTNSFLKGDKGDNVGVIQVNLGSVDPNTTYRIRNISNSVTASRLKSEIQTAISNNFESSTLGQSIGGHNWYDNLSEGSIYLLYDSKNGNEYNIISSIPYTHIDARFQNINSDTEHKHFNGKVDTSGIVYIDDNGIQFNQPFPTLYYNNLDAPEDKQGQSGFFWKINGEKTGIRADGPQGKNGKDSTWGIVRVDATYNGDKDYTISAVWDETATSDKWKTGSENINKILTNSQRVVGIIGNTNTNQYSMFFGVVAQTTDGFTVNITDNNRVPNVFSEYIFDEITTAIGTEGHLPHIKVGPDENVKLDSDSIEAPTVQATGKVAENQGLRATEALIGTIQTSKIIAQGVAVEIGQMTTGIPSTPIYTSALLRGTAEMAKKLGTISGGSVSFYNTEKNQPVCFQAGVPTTLNAVGGTTTPIYIDSDGKIQTCNLTSIGSADNAGNADKVTINSPTGSGYLSFTTGTSNSQTLYATSNVQCAKESNTWRLKCDGGFYETSDETLKNFGDDVSIDFEKLAKLPKKHFTWKSDEEGLNLQIGTSAQAVKELYPEIVSGEEGSYSVAYDKLSIIALAAIDKLYAQNKQKDEEIQLLKQEIAVIKQMINDKL